MQNASGEQWQEREFSRTEIGLLLAKCRRTIARFPSMIGTFYVFERVSPDNVASCSWAAKEILGIATRNVAGIRFHELTDRTNPKPMFAVLFASEMLKIYFEGMLERLVENSDLRIEIAQPAQRVPVGSMREAANRAEIEGRGNEEAGERSLRESA